MLTLLASQGRWLGLVVGLLWLSLGTGACWQPSSPTPQKGAANGAIASAIIGGMPDLQHPAVGALTISKQTFCTATLIATRVVLTAGHCIDAARSRGGQGTLQFRVDVPNPLNPQGFDATHYDIEFNLLSLHPDWNGNASRGFDLGIAILKQSVPSTIARVIPFNDTPLNDQWLTKEPLFLGYGYTQSVPTAITPNRKYGTTIPIIRVSSNAIEHRAPGKSVCHGDSGGPALFTINGQVRVIAINSYVTAGVVPNSAPQRSSCDASGVSFRTDVYRRYINSMLTQYGDGPAVCATDLDCGACGACGTKLTCEPRSFPATPSACLPCQQDSDCGGGNVCHRFAEGFRCLQACTQDGCCPDGTVCTPLSSGSKGWHCVPKQGKCADAPCQANKDCGPGEACQAGVCRPDLPPRSPRLCHPCESVHDCDSPSHLCYGPKGNEQCLQPCGAGDFCPQGFRCQQLYPGAPKQCSPEQGTCHVLCQLDEHCPAGFACTKGVCGRKGGGVHGDTCDPAPCQAAFQCVETLGGKRCMRPCGVPNGNSGSPCNQEKACTDGSRCFSFGSDFHVCLRDCSNDGDCALSGGGRCDQGICTCLRDSECAQNYTCNTSTQSVGACSKTALETPCPTNFECRTFSDGPFCVPEGGGVRGLGEACDSLNRCNRGLACIGTESGPICLEDCTQSRQCQLGGTCIQYGRSLSLCLCSGTDCPTSRTCQPLFQGQYGYCKSEEAAPGCLADQECPPAHTCKMGACVANPPPPPREPAPPEPSAEPAPDVTTTPEPATPEPATPEPAASEPSLPDASPDTGAVLDAAPIEPRGGCGCSALSAAQVPSSLPLTLLLLVGLLPWIRQRSGKHLE